MNNTICLLAGKFVSPSLTPILLQRIFFTVHKRTYAKDDDLYELQRGFLLQKVIFHQYPITIQYLMNCRISI